MFGSKNSEFTRKYGLRSFASSTFVFVISRWPVANSMNPIAANDTARPTVSTRQARSTAGVQRTVSSSRNSSANGT